MLSQDILDLMQNLGFISGGLFVVLGAFDGIYFHIVKYQLHRFAESRLEHLIHGLRGVLLAATGFLLFSNAHKDSPYLSTALAACIAVVAVDLALEVCDIYVEKASRANLGGISSTEMVLHVFASSFRLAALTLLLTVAYARGFSETVQPLGLILSGVALVVSLITLIPQRTARQFRVDVLRIV